MDHRRLSAVTCFVKITAVMFVLLFTGCKDDDSNNPNTEVVIKPRGPKPTWGPTITNPMLRVIEKLDSLSPEPLYNLTPQQARLKPTPADAVKEVMKEYKVAMPASTADTLGKNIPVMGGMLHLRTYTPKSGTAPFPVIVYYHGGGWVIGGIDVYDASTRALAEQAGAVVVSVAYRRAPEFKFPTAHNDAYAAYKWVVNNIASINGRAGKIAVAGESAGGNMAAAVSMMARDSGFAMPVHQLLVYPVANNDLTTPSYIQYANAKPLSKPLIEWFVTNYFRTTADGDDKRISLVDAPLNNLPSATIIAAEIDPLQSEGKTLSDKLQAAGVKVTYKLYNGVVHEFFGMGTIIPEAREAQKLAADELKAAFNR